MSLWQTPTREFKAGSTGWSLDDLRDPEIRRLWDTGHFEIIDGVLTPMPAARLGHGGPIGHLIFVLKTYSAARSLDWIVAPEVDVAAMKDRVVRADAVLMTPDDVRQQKALGSWDDDVDDVGIVRLPPTLIIEALSRGHERRDRVTKREMYGKFGVRNFWILDRGAKSMECLVLENEAYRTDVSGSVTDVLRPSTFPELQIPLKDLWRA